jgi:hypothetical protein
MLCTAQDPNISEYVARREAEGMPAIEHGTVYDIISKICDHELAEVITRNMIKHDEAKANEKENDDQTKAKEKENDDQAKAKENDDQAKAKEKENEDPKDPAQPQPPRGRQSLGEYFISHPPTTYAPFGQSHSPEEEPEVHQAPEDVLGYEDDQPQEQDKVSCFVVLTFLNGQSLH